MLKVTILLAALSAVLPSPVPEQETRVLYDQRQEGELNVHADLKNIVVMVIQPSSATSTAPSTGTLLDYLLRTIPKKSTLKKLKRKEVPGEETMHFIESKTAPYHVDISRSKSHLARLHPEVPLVKAEEIVIAKSPTIELVKDEHHRVARAFVVTVPEDYEKKKKKQVPKSMMKLLGAENEQCGPGLFRDEEGVCRTIKD